MTMQVVQPKQQANDGLGKALTIGGGVAGAAFGGPMGAVSGAGMGQSAAGMLSKPQEQAPIVQASQSDAMGRRLGGDDTLAQLAEAKSALATLPPQEQKQYEAPINQAYAMEQRKRGMV